MAETCVAALYNMYKNIPYLVRTETYVYSVHRYIRFNQRQRKARRNG